jgi:hypothetical protein
LSLAIVKRLTIKSQAGQAGLGIQVRVYYVLHTSPSGFGSLDLYLPYPSVPSANSKTLHIKSAQLLFQASFLGLPSKESN